MTRNNTTSKLVMELITKILNWFNPPDVIGSIKSLTPERSREISARPLGGQGNYVHGKSHVVRRR